LESSKLTAGKIQHAATVDEICTAYTDSTFMTSCGGIEDHIPFLPLYLPAVSLELSKHHTHIYIPSSQPIAWLCDLHNQLREIVRPAKKLGSIYIHVFKEIRSYLYTRVQRN
jgi:hypothetical protein